MKEEELLKIRERYTELVNLKEEVTKIKENMEELKKVPEVQKYIELYDKLNSWVYYDVKHADYKHLAESLARSKGVTPTTNIYCYIGTYQYDENMDPDKIGDFSEDMDFVSFTNIETFKSSIKVKPEDLQEFVKENIIVSPTELCQDGAMLYYMVQNEYFETCVKEGQDKAIEKCKKYAREGFVYKKF